MTDLTIPDLDVLGEPTAPSSWTRSHWAVLLENGYLEGHRGPLLLGAQSEAEARNRLAAWQDKQPEANPRLVRRKVVETFGEWEAAE